MEIITKFKIIIKINLSKGEGFLGLGTRFLDGFNFFGISWILRTDQGES
jgi:hypothetical protein